MTSQAFRTMSHSFMRITSTFLIIKRKFQSSLHRWLACKISILMATYLISVESRQEEMAVELKKILQTSTISMSHQGYNSKKRRINSRHQLLFLKQLRQYLRRLSGRRSQFPRRRSLQAKEKHLQYQNHR